MFHLLQIGEPTVSLGTSNLYIQAVILLVSIIAVAFFSSAEASLISVNKLRIRYLAERGNRSARSVMQVVNQHEKFFATILLTENAFIIFASSVGTAIAINLGGGSGIILLLAPLIMTVLIVTFGEITPKTLAAGASERWSLRVAHPIKIIMTLETYIIYLFTLLPRFILKLMGGKAITWTPLVTEGELRMLIDISKEEGAMPADEAALLEKVFRFGDEQVQEVMTPRPDIVWVEHGATFKDFLALYLEHNHTRYPVYQGTTENVIGILSVKDVMTALGKDESSPKASVTTLLRPVHFVPETKSVASTFTEMQREGHNMVLAVDEFGGIAGLFTSKQLLEVIVGQVTGEGETPGEEYVALDENTYLVDAGVSVVDINEKLKLDLPEGDYQTLAGFVLDRLGRIPEGGEMVQYNNLRLTVKAMDELRVDQVEILRLPEVSEEGQ